MVLRRILQASIILVLTLACAAVFGPLETSIPPSATPSSTPVLPRPTETPTPEIAATQDAPVVQIGYFNSIYLRYDPQVWKVFDETYGHQLLNEEGKPIRALHHLTIPGCTLHDNLGRGVPPTWERQVTNRMIGSLEFRVEAWTDTEAQKQVLIVYQYPAGEEAVGKRIELVIDQEAEACIQSAEEVLSLSADLISSQP